MINDPRIMVVEDNKNDQMFLKVALEREAVGGSIDFFDSAEAAMEDLGSSSKIPNLIVTDLSMPGMSGLELLTKLKTSARSRQIPTIILSTSSAANDISSAYDRYANTYMVKPSSIQGYRQIAKTIRQYWFEDAVLPNAF